MYLLPVPAKKILIRPFRNTKAIRRSDSSILKSYTFPQRNILLRVHSPPGTIRHFFLWHHSTHFKAIFLNKLRITNKLKLLIMKSIILSSVIVLIALFSVSTVVAQSPHLVKKGFGGVNVEGTAICTFGEISGLGNLSTFPNVTFQLFVTATYTVTCFNPANNTAVGQSRLTADFSSPAITRTIDDNGRASFGTQDDQLCTADITGTCQGNALTPVVSNIKVVSAYISINNDEFRVPLK